MMIGSSPATAIVAYRGVIREVPRDAVQPIASTPLTSAQDLMRHRVRVFGMPDALVDLIA